MSLLEYYWTIYGYTSRMAVQRGFDIQKTIMNEYFLGFETYDFIARQEHLNNIFDSKEISEEEYVKQQESLIKEEQSLIDRSMKAFDEELSFKGKYITLKGTVEGLSVLFVIVKNHGVSFVTDTYTKLQNDLKREIQNSKLCIITSSLPSSTLLKKFSNPGITYMLHDDLTYDPSYHVLTPKHILLRDDEKKKYLQETGMIPAHMVKLPRSDVMVKWLGAAPGQIIKVITRLDSGAMFDIKYMVVTKDEFSSKKKKGF